MNGTNNEPPELHDQNPHPPNQNDPPKKNEWLNDLVPQQQLPPPQIDHQFKQLPTIPRAIESIRFGLRCLEHWLSPSGRFRLWIAVNLRFFLWLGLPILLFTPLIGYLLRESSFMAKDVHTILNHLTMASLPLAFLAGIAILVLLIIRR